MRSALRCFQERGYFLDLAGAAKSRFGHVFCGAQEIPGARCPGCSRRFLRMLSLDTRDPRLDFRRIPPSVRPAFVHLIYCWRCGGGLDYRLNPHGGVDLLEHGAYDPKPEADDFPYENYPEHFPKRRPRLLALRRSAQNLIRRENAGRTPKALRWKPAVRRWFVPRNQVGGEPYLEQGSRRDGEESCALCGRPMSLLACLGDENGTRKGFTDNADVQVLFFLCAPCCVVHAHNECD